MTPPLFVDYRGDFVILDDPSQALTEIEEWDVDEIAAAYDSLGRLLRVRLTDYGHEPHNACQRFLKRVFIGARYRTPVVIEAAEATPTHGDELARKLRAYLCEVDQIDPASIENASLDELVEMMIRQRDSYKSR